MTDWQKIAEALYIALVGSRGINVAYRIGRQPGESTIRKAMTGPSALVAYEVAKGLGSGER